MNKLNKNQKLFIVFGIVVFLAAGIYLIDKTFAEFGSMQNDDIINETISKEIDKSILDGVGIGDSIRVMVIRG